MNVHQVLVAARALITNKGSYKHPNTGAGGVPGRIVGSIFTNLNGERTFKRDKAECFCSLGAIIGAIGCDTESSGGGLGSHPTDNTVRNVNGVLEVITTPTKAQRKSYFTAIKYLENAIRVVMGGVPFNVIGFNDGINDHKKVLAAFDLAAKNAKRRHLSKLPKAVAQ